MCCSAGKEALRSSKELPTEKPHPEEENGGLLSRPRLEKMKKERKNSAEYNVLRFSLTFQITFFFFFNKATEADRKGCSWVWGELQVCPGFDA